MGRWQHDPGEGKGSPGPLSKRLPLWGSEDHALGLGVKGASSADTSRTPRSPALHRNHPAFPSCVTLRSPDRLLSAQEPPTPCSGRSIENQGHQGRGQILGRGQQPCTGGRSPLPSPPSAGFFPFPQARSLPYGQLPGCAELQDELGDHMLGVSPAAHEGHVSFCPPTQSPPWSKCTCLSPHPRLLPSLSHTTVQSPHGTCKHSEPCASFPTHGWSQDKPALVTRSTRSSWPLPAALSNVPKLLTKEKR